MKWLKLNPFNLKKIAAPIPARGNLTTEYAVEDVFSQLDRLPDPDIVLKELGYGREVLRNLETDDEISGALDTRRDAVIATPWTLEGKQGPNLQFAKDQLSQVFNQLVCGSWSATPYGYSVLEVVYCPEEGLIGFDHITEKPFEWFEPKNDGRLMYTPSGGGVQESVDTDFKFFLTARNASYRNPYGEALLSRIYWAWFFRYNNWQFWMQFVERFGEPILLGNANSPAAMVEALQGMGYESILAVGLQETLTPVTNKSSGEHGELENTLQRRIQKLILGQTLTTDVGSTGSFAAAKVHNEVRNDKRMSDIRMVSGTVQNIINALWRVNRFSGDAPVFTMSDGTGLQIERANRDATLSNAGVVRLTEDYLLRTYDYEAGDFTIPERPAPTGLKLSSERLDRKPRFTKGQQRLESLADEVLEESGSPLSDEQLRDVILSATDPDDLENKLMQLVKDVDPVVFRDLSERALFAADVLGYDTDQRGQV